MSESVGCTWPEQDAVWAWMERHEITLTKEQENDLKRAVTGPRISETKAREQAERERDELRKALHSLLLEAECYAGMSKHLMRECEEARRVLGGG